MKKTDIIPALLKGVVVTAAFLVIIGAIKLLLDKVPTYTEVEMNVSAYCKGECCCGDFADGITASGKPATGKLIAAPPNYPFGTKMDVPGYGEAVVFDRGGAIQGNKIDLLFPSHQDALDFGRQFITVKVYK
jgi:3D (Asp-Asp-Asp) domain-containing protein